MSGLIIGLQILIVTMALYIIAECIMKRKITQGIVEWVIIISAVIIVYKMVRG